MLFCSRALAQLQYSNLEPVVLGAEGVMMAVLLLEGASVGVESFFFFFLFLFLFFFFFFGVVSTPVVETTPGPDAMAGGGPSV